MQENRYTYYYFGKLIECALRTPTEYPKEVQDVQRRKIAILQQRSNCGLNRGSLGEKPEIIECGGSVVSSAGK